MDVMGKLVEHDDKREPPAWGIGPRVECACCGIPPRARKRVDYTSVDKRGFSEPERALSCGDCAAASGRTKPEIEDACR